MYKLYLLSDSKMTCYAQNLMWHESDELIIIITNNYNIAIVNHL